MKSIQIIFDNKLGGVLNVYLKLHERFRLIYNFSFLVLGEDTNHKIDEKLEQLGIDFRIIKYSRFDNKYVVLKKIADAILPNNIIIASNFLEIEAYCYKKLNNPLIYYVHGMFDLQFNIANKYSGVIDGYIVVSEYIKNKLKNDLPNNSNIIYLKHFINQKNELNKKYFIDDRINLIYVGRMLPSKGSLDLPKIYDSLELSGINFNFRIVFSGEVDEKYCQKFNKKNCIIYRNIGLHEIEDLLKKTDVLLLPSYFEGFPLTVVEAMQSGVIPIVYNIESGIPEIIQQSENGFLVNKGNWAEMVNQVIELSFSKDIIEKIGKTSAKSIKKFFNLISQEELFKNFIIQNDNNKKSKEYPSQFLIKKSSLDIEYLPNFFVILIRKFKFILYGK